MRSGFTSEMYHPRNATVLGLTVLVIDLLWQDEQYPIEKISSLLQAILQVFDLLWIASRRRICECRQVSAIFAKHDCSIPRNTTSVGDDYSAWQCQTSCRSFGSKLAWKSSCDSPKTATLLTWHKPHGPLHIPKLRMLSKRTTFCKHGGSAKQFSGLSGLNFSVQTEPRVWNF